MTASPSLMWFHSDLRMKDNPALRAAALRGNPLICLFIWNPDASGYAKPGAASRWWLHHTLQAFSAALQQAGNGLMLQSGPFLHVLCDVVKRFSVSHVFGNYVWEPHMHKSQQDLMKWLDEENIEGTFFHGNTLIDPTTVLTKSSHPYSMFTPFYRNVQSQLKLSSPLPASKTLPPVPKENVKSVSLDSLDLLPKIDWAQGIRKTWRPGEAGAQQIVQQFLRSAATVYATDRDRPDSSSTSKLSPYLHFGEISPRQVWHAISRQMTHQMTPQHRKSYIAYLRQLIWREFGQYLLCHFPYTAENPLYPDFKNFPWRHNSTSLRAWQEGKTGYPLIDAGMRELWHTGWMHNRVRMIVGSFLTKDLLQPWQQGARWFWETLVDADLANNTLGWQWVAGCGADASPFFRIFNPIAQGRKFDPDGYYVRRWVPELSQLPPAWIHTPWTAPQSVLQEAGVALGKTYPNPIIDHAFARSRALAAYQNFKQTRRHKPESPMASSM